MHLLPHWNWPDEFRGKAIPVWVYTNAESVELFLNGKSLGTRDWTGVKETHLTWQVPYEPGTLRAVGRKGGKVIAPEDPGVSANIAFGAFAPTVWKTATGYSMLLTGRKLVGQGVFQTKVMDTTSTDGIT